MSGLNNVQLSETVLASIYKNTLIISDDAQPIQKIPEVIEDKITTVPKEKTIETAPVVKPLPAKWFLGDNAKGVVIVVKDSENVYLDETKLQLLSSILSACKMNLADVAIVNYLQTPVSINDIKANTTINYLLAFGINSIELQLSKTTTSSYQLQTIDNCNMIFAPDLNVMTGTSNEAKLEKSKLWVALKGMFNI